jgi:hypothetical protein
MRDATTRLQVPTASEARAAGSQAFYSPVTPHGFKAEAERLHQYGMIAVI